MVAEATELVIFLRFEAVLNESSGRGGELGFWNEEIDVPEIADGGVWVDTRRAIGRTLE